LIPRSAVPPGVWPGRLSRRTALAYPVRVTSLPDSRALRRFAAGLVLGGAVLSADLAAAQGLPFAGFTALPSFAWPQPGGGDSRWAGSYARLSTGFEVSSSKRFGSHAGPTVGFEGGRMWQEGRLVYGIVGGFDYLAAIGGGATPGFGGLSLSRDFSGALQVKVGALLTPDVLLYAKAGASAVHEKLRFGATPFSLPFAREDVAVRPDARVGVEWAVTDRLSVSVESGVAGQRFVECACRGFRLAPRALFPYMSFIR
jgi:outer membrane immunogenic protein